MYPILHSPRFGDVILFTLGRKDVVFYPLGHEHSKVSNLFLQTTTVPSWNVTFAFALLTDAHGTSSESTEFKTKWGLPWWRSGWESACRCRGHGFEPWSGKIPHAAEQLGPWATTTEPARLEPVLRNERPRWWEACAPRWGVAPACHNWRKPSHRNEDPTQP